MHFSAGDDADTVTRGRARFARAKQKLRWRCVGVLLIPPPQRSLRPLCGYGIRACVDRGHLLLEDGCGTDRHTIRLPRVGHGLESLVVIGSDGFVSLAALRWLTDQDAAFVMLERNGKTLCVTGPVGSSDAKLRRAQALAIGNGTGLKSAGDLSRPNYKVRKKCYGNI